MNKNISKKTTRGRGLVVAVVVAVLLLVVVIVSSLMVMQSPEKQLASGFANFMTAKSIAVDGTVATSTANSKLTLSVAGVTDKKVADGQMKFDYATNTGLKLDGKVQLLVSQDKTMFAKIDQPKKLMESYATVLIQSVPAFSAGVATDAQRSAIETQLRSSFTSFGEKLDNKWVKISQDDLRKFGGSNIGSDCYIAFAQKLNSDASARNQLANAYQKNRFFKITNKLDPEGSSAGYRVGIDQAKLKDFKDSVATNEAVKQLGNCGLDILTLGASDELSDRTADIWIDRFSHAITHIKYSKTSDTDVSSDVDLKFSYDKSVQVTTPATTVNFDSLMPQGISIPTAQ